MNTSSYLGYEPPPDFGDHSLETGAWCRIFAEPDSFTGERINIGVGIVDREGRRYSKVITERGRLECVFGTNDADSILMLADTAKKCFEAGTTPLFENVFFGDPIPLLNRAPSDALGELFLDQVTFALPHRAETKKPKDWLDKEETRSKVYELIRQKIPSNKVELLIPEHQEIQVPIGGANRVVKVPLQPRNGAGALESACYSTATVKSHLMDSMLDIQTVATARHLKHVGMFVFRSTTGLSKISLHKMDNLIDDVLWRAPKNWKIEIESDPEVLTEKILDWSDLKAAA